MSEFPTALERAIWQIERGIRWEHQIRTANGISVTPEVLLDVLREAVGQESLTGFRPNTHDEVLQRAKVLLDQERARLAESGLVD